METKIEITCSCGRKSIESLFPGKKEYTCETCGAELFKAHITNGYVYVLSNPAMPNLLKIGYTDREVDERVDELNSTGVPVSFEVEAIFGSPNAYKDEQAIHSMLAQHRLANNREFFSIAVKEAVQCIIDYIGSEPNFLKSPDLLMTEAEKHAHREQELRKIKQRQLEEQARREQEAKKREQEAREREQRRIDDRKCEIIRNKGIREIMIKQISASDPLLAREVRLRYEAELKELGLESLDERAFEDGVPKSPDLLMAETEEQACHEQEMIENEPRMLEERKRAIRESIEQLRRERGQSLEKRGQ